MNRIYFGDNLPILKSLPDESIDLIYIDPPFNTKKTQKRSDRKSTRLNSSHSQISYAVFCLKKKNHRLTPGPCVGQLPQPVREDSSLRRGLHRLVSGFGD